MTFKTSPDKRLRNPFHKRPPSGVHRKKSLIPPPEEDDVFCRHPGKDLAKISREFLDAHPDDSFCFLNIGRLRENIRLVLENFLPGDERKVVSYSVKANPKAVILKTMVAEGLDSFDCASPAEIQQVQRFAPEAKIYYNNPVKSRSDISYAAQRGVDHYTVQTKQEIDKILEASAPFTDQNELEVAVRLITPYEQGEIDLSSKFGANPLLARALLHDIRQSGVRRPGISMHVGSQLTDPNIFWKSIDFMADIARKEGGVKTFNIGGGLPVSYTSKLHYDRAHFLKIITHSVHENTRGSFLRDPQVIIELGRALVAESVDLFIPVLSAEKRDGKPCVYFNDGVFSCFSDAVIHDWKYPIGAINRKGKVFSQNIVPTTVFGRTCDSGDVLRGIPLPEDIDDGDHLWVPNAGAYMDSQSTQFNGFAPPKYVTYNA